MHVTVFFTAFCSYDWPEAFAQRQRVQLAQHTLLAQLTQLTQLACQGPAAAVVSHLPLAASQHSRRLCESWSVASVSLACDFYALAHGAAVLQWVSIQPATGRPCLFCLSFHTVHPPSFSGHTDNPVSTHRESFRSSGEKKELDAVCLPSPISHAAFKLVLLVCKLNIERPSSGTCR